MVRVFQPLGRKCVRSSEPEGWRSMLIFGRPVRFGQGRRFYLQYYNISDMFRPTLVFIKLWMTENIQMFAVQVVTIPKRKSQMKSKSKSWYYSPSFLLPALARPSAPAPPSPGKACPAWCSPWSPWSPMNATSLVSGLGGIHSCCLAEYLAGSSLCSRPRLLAPSGSFWSFLGRSLWNLLFLLHVPMCSVSIRGFLVAHFWGRSDVPALGNSNYFLSLPHSSWSCLHTLHWIL